MPAKLSEEVCGVVERDSLFVFGTGGPSELGSLSKCRDGLLMAAKVTKAVGREFQSAGVINVDRSGLLSANCRDRSSASA